MAYERQESDRKQIVAAARAFAEIEQLVLFGSRAKGSQKRGSDGGVEGGVHGSPFVVIAPRR